MPKDLRRGHETERDDTTLTLSGKVVIITGAGSGIGQSAAVLFSTKGCKVAVLDKSARGRETSKKIGENGGESIFICADVSDESSVTRAVSDVVRTWNSIDILVNNAGVQFIGSVTDTPTDQWDQVLATNLKGAYLVSKHVLPSMINAKRGTIVNVASICGLVAYPDFAAYCASKGGVLMLTKSMALDYARYNIRVNCVCPGEIHTKMTEEYYAQISEPDKALQEIIKRIPLGRYGQPQEVAEAILYLASDESTYLTGASLIIDGGMTIQ